MRSREKSGSNNCCYADSLFRPSRRDNALSAEDAELFCFDLRVVHFARLVVSVWPGWYGVVARTSSI
jgi:hypothetical protein